MLEKANEYIRQNYIDEKEKIAKNNVKQKAK